MAAAGVPGLPVSEACTTPAFWPTGVVVPVDAGSIDADPVVALAVTGVVAVLFPWAFGASGAEPATVLVRAAVVATEGSAPLACSATSVPTFVTPACNDGMVLVVAVAEAALEVAPESDLT